MVMVAAGVVVRGPGTEAVWVALGDGGASGAWAAAGVGEGGAALEGVAAEGLHCMPACMQACRQAAEQAEQIDMQQGVARQPCDGRYPHCLK